VCRSTALMLLSVAAAGLAQSPKPTIWEIEQCRKLWLGIKNGLTGTDGSAFFENNIKGSDVPRLIGTVVAAIPEDHPGVLRIAIEDSRTAEVALRLGGTLNAPVPRGSLVAFKGIPTDFSEEPFQLWMQVSESGVWTWDPPGK
jgi:hypothetical protein